jgi:hypothetical protein
MLASVLLGALAIVRDARRSLDHVEEERTAQWRRRRLRGIQRISAIISRSTARLS